MLTFVLETGLCFDEVISKLYTKLYVHVTVHRDEFPYNKTN
jgi:hypothetical protein